MFINSPDLLIVKGFVLSLDLYILAQFAQNILYIYYITVVIFHIINGDVVYIIIYIIIMWE